MASQSNAERVGANVRAELARRRLSQTRLADALGISQTGVSARLNGRVPFDVEELARTAAYLEVPVEVLIAAPLAVAG